MTWKEWRDIEEAYDQAEDLEKLPKFNDWVEEKEPGKNSEDCPKRPEKKTGECDDIEET